MLPGVGVFGTSLTARVIIPLLKDEGFAVKALWGRTQEEAEELAKEMSVPFYTSRIDEVLLHQDVDLVCINLPPPLTRQIAVKTLGQSEEYVPKDGDHYAALRSYLELTTGLSSMFGIVSRGLGPVCPFLSYFTVRAVAQCRGSCRSGVEETGRAAVVLLPHGRDAAADNEMVHLDLTLTILKSQQTLFPFLP
ncbi:Glucose-fructose oxidoreductase domain-containing protein 1 [Galemys pyrenaicus]|uniref:Glucose-fructose oxidoreductase domain-containing protein 1 n=1 Tax=Galemys pyrenaicus TaxID=202257 RepID=A0A8J6A9J1_GALPY|nr:Glucose-fructose oxidoreductase domain-containing protein 1 [Galemys pyrenaicus]